MFDVVQSNTFLNEVVFQKVRRMVNGYPPPEQNDVWSRAGDVAEGSTGPSRGLPPLPQKFAGHTVSEWTYQS